MFVFSYNNVKSFLNNSGYLLFLKITCNIEIIINQIHKLSKQ